MSESFTLQIAQRGVLTLPKALRDTYNLHPGDALTLLDLGGVFVLTPRRSEVDHLADRVARELSQRGESLESMLVVLREARQGYDTKD